MSELQEVIGRRIRDARDKLGLRQDAVAKMVGFSSAQILSQIEKGGREIKAWELSKICKALKTDMRVILAEEEPEPTPLVLWRKSPLQDREQKEAEFLHYCHTYKNLEVLNDVKPNRLLPDIEVDPNTISFSDAAKAAFVLGDSLCLGSRPATSLGKILEDGYGVKIWHLDLGDDGSGASVRGAFGSAILINSREAPWRRNFSLAHELFHLVTWKSLPPERLKSNKSLWHKTEQVAEAFASSLLLPESEVGIEFTQRVQNKKISYGDLVGIARDFDVSAEALIFRLTNLGRVHRDKAKEALKDPNFRAVDRKTMSHRWYIPRPFPQRFVTLAFLAYKKGLLSRMRLGEYLGTSLFDLEEKLLEYGLNETQDYYETKIPAA